MEKFVYENMEERLIRLEEKIDQLLGGEMPVEHHHRIMASNQFI